MGLYCIFCVLSKTTLGLRQHFKNFKINAHNYEIKPCNTIKILGTFIRQDLKWDTEIGKLTSNLHHKLHNIRKLNKFTNVKSRLAFINGFILGKLSYMIPLYMNATGENITKLHRLLMAAARAAIGSYCCRKSISQILDKCNWLPIRNMIVFAAIKTIHKIVITNIPKSIRELIKNARKMRKNQMMSPAYIPKNNQIPGFLYD